MTYEETLNPFVAEDMPEDEEVGDEEEVKEKDADDTDKEEEEEEYDTGGDI